MYYDFRMVRGFGAVCQPILLVFVVSSLLTVCGVLLIMQMTLVSTFDNYYRRLKLKFAIVHFFSSPTGIALG